jgi:hypothetical protein
MKADCKELADETEINKIRERVFEGFLARLIQEDLIVRPGGVGVEEKLPVNKNESL